MTSWRAAFFALLALAVAVSWLARRSRAGTGLPTGRLVYADTTRWQSVERPLFSRSHRLTGRPDYLVQRERHTIPVEVKSGCAPGTGPHTSHILQLMAYCLLVEETYGRRPPYGIIFYTAGDRQAFEVDYTAESEEDLLTILEKMRWALADSKASRDHNQIARCRACGYRSNCDQSLA